MENETKSKREVTDSKVGFTDLALLRRADNYANTNSGCLKVKVGAAIVPKKRPIEQILFGANRSLPSCKAMGGCNRMRLYGDDSKEHRLPSDCNALHSEVDAIANAADLGVSTWEATIYVTRYPCEACARAIVAAGIKTVVYGRKQAISEVTETIFQQNAIRVVHNNEFDAEDTNR